MQFGLNNNFLLAELLVQKGYIVVILRLEEIGSDRVAQVVLVGEWGDGELRTEFRRPEVEMHYLHSVSHTKYLSKLLSFITYVLVSLGSSKVSIPGCSYTRNT